MNEIIYTMAYITRKRRECNTLTRSSTETLADERDRALALWRLSKLEREARQMFQSRLDRKRARKRAAAIRHRANGIFNQFHRAVCKRAAFDIRATFENLRAGKGVAIPYGWKLGYYDWARNPPEPVLFYPSAIIKVFID